MGFWQKDINLIPEAQAKEKKKRTAVFYTRLGLWIIIFLCVVNLLFQGVGFGYLTYVNTTAKREIERLAPIRDKDADVRTKTEYINKRTTQMASIRRDEMLIVPFIELLEKALPIAVETTDVYMNENGAITITGTVPNEFFAADVVMVLKESELFEDAELISMNMQKDKRTGFVIQGKMAKI